MMKPIKIIKIGGKVIDDEGKLDTFLNDLATISGPKILVHGGGSIASKMSEKLGVKPNMLDGRRVTDAKTLEVITMVYGGLVNKRIVAKLQGLGCNSAGLSGADLNLIKAKKRNPEPVDFGWVGDIEKVNADWLLELLRHDIIPVLAPLTHDGKGNILNTNADTIASGVASVLAEFEKTELILCFEQSGVMNVKTLISELNEGLYHNLKESKVITDGMIPKIDVGFQALKKGVKKVSIRSFETVKEKESGTGLVL